MIRMEQNSKSFRWRMDKFYIWFIILHIVFFVNRLQCFDTLVCENGWELREGKCYLRIEVSSQTQGVQLCSDVNGFLIMPKTANENAIVMELLQLWGFSRMWIGLANNYGNNEYIWEDGTKLIDTGYTNWRIGEPNGAEPMCVEFYQAGWNDNPCNRFFTVVCQKDADIDDCVSRPCQNGGTCIDRFDGFNCSCTSEYDGIFCEKEVLSRDTEIQVNENESVLLICVIHHMNTTSTLFWTRSVDNTSVMVSEYAEGGDRLSPNLFFANIKWTDEGIYTCHVQKIDGRIETDDVHVRLNTSTAMCPCQCAYRRKLEYWASKIAPNKTLNELLKDLQPFIQKIKVDLLVEKSKLSLEISKHISTVDNRKSSQTIGVVGAALIIIVLGLILAIDFSTLLYHFKKGCSPKI